MMIRDELQAYAAMLAMHFARLGYLNLARKRAMAGNSGHKLGLTCNLIRAVMAGM